MNLCETTIVYNGLTLKNVLTESIDQTIVRDSTNTDPIGLRVTIIAVADAHVSDDVEHGINVNWTGKKNISPGLRALVEKLCMPRKEFIYSINDEVLYDIRPSSVESCNSVDPGDKRFDQDIEHGPWSDVNVLSIKGSRSAKCRFTFRFVIPICDEKSNLGDVLNLRYWIGDDIDCTKWLTSRRYEGVFRVRTRNPAINPIMLARQLTLPPLQKGFRRSHIGWHESPNGLECSFSIIDVEQWAQAPSPATHWHGTYSVSIPQGATFAEAELNCSLMGDKGVNKRYLLKLLQQILWYKMQLFRMMGGQTMLILNQVWHEDLAENEVGVNMRIQYVDPKFINCNLPAGSGVIGTSFELGLPLNKAVSDFADNPRKKKYDKEVATNPGLPTATTAGLFVCALQNDCCTQSLSSPGSPTDTPVTPPTVAPITPPLPDAEFSNYENRWSSDAKSSIYLWYKVTNRYYEDTGWRAFPLGKQCNTASSSELPDTVAFSHLHCPVSVREVTISACRVDNWPSIPFRQHWTDSGNVSDVTPPVKFVLKSSKIVPSAVQLTADGMHELRQVEMVLSYYMSRPYTPAEYISVGQSDAIGTWLTDSCGISPSAFGSPQVRLGANVP